MSIHARHFKIENNLFITSNLQIKQCFEGCPARVIDNIKNKWFRPETIYQGDEYCSFDTDSIDPEMYLIHVSKYIVKKVLHILYDEKHLIKIWEKRIIDKWINS